MILEVGSLDRGLCIELAPVYQKPVFLDACQRCQHLARMTGSVPPHAQKYMETALAEAAEAALREEVPVGAVIVDTASNKILAVAGNRTEELRDATAHAEMLVLQEAAKIYGGTRLVDCDLYVTLDPCAMCAAAISMARIRRLYFGASDPKSGGVESGTRFFSQPTCHHCPDVYGGIDELRSRTMLQDFFEVRR